MARAFSQNVEREFHLEVEQKKTFNFTFLSHPVINREMSLCKGSPNLKKLIVAKFGNIAVTEAH